MPQPVTTVFLAELSAEENANRIADALADRPNNVHDTTIPLVWGNALLARVRELEGQLRRRGEPTGYAEMIERIAGNVPTHRESRA